MNQSIYFGMMTTTGFENPPDIAPNYQNPQNAVPTCHPKSLFSTLIENNIY
jgi:hypothetical protein